MPPMKHAHGPKAKTPGKTLLRLLGYLKKYAFSLIVVAVCIFISAFASTKGSENIGTLIDDFITPMLKSGSEDYGPLLRYLVSIGCIFAAGMVASFLQQFLMASVGQGTQRVIRDEMFTKMQHLPIRYFDSNTAGNIMSRFTSDIDTLRQMISQSIPQAFSSIVTVVVILVAMLRTSWILTLVMCFTVSGIMVVTMKVVKKSGKYFIGQQTSLGKLNGYVEEMIHGQKVVKVFNHEPQCKEEFDRLNEELCQNAYTAGKLSNMMGPVNNNLGYPRHCRRRDGGGLRRRAAESGRPGDIPDPVPHF